MKYLFGLLAIAAVLTLSSDSRIAHADNVVPPPVDLGADVMKPMGALFKTIGTSITDGTKNASNVQALSDLSDKIDVAITITPTTDAYKAEVALVGADNAFTKYQSLLKALKVSVLELSATLKTKSAAACGTACDSILGQINQFAALGHATFKD